MPLRPIADFLRYHARFFTGKVKISPRGQAALPGAPAGYRPFLTVARKSPTASPAAALRVTFRVHKVNFWQRTLLPYGSIPFFAGAPGFISKTYLVNPQENSFCGLYQWESAQAAQTYIESYQGRFMRRNALPGSVSFEIQPIADKDEA